MELLASTPLSVTATVPSTVGASSAGPGPAIPLILLPPTGPTTNPPLSVNAAGKRAAMENSEERNGRPHTGPMNQTTTENGPATADDVRELIGQVVRQQVQQILAETPSGLPPVPSLNHQGPPVMEHHPVAAAHHTLPAAAGPAPAPPTGASLEVLLRSLQPLLGASPTLIPAPCQQPPISKVPALPILIPQAIVSML
jgi:hypothetical protein